MARRLKPFLLRRTKQQVAAELPEKTEIVQTVMLEGKQRDFYETIRLAMDKKVRQEINKKGLARSHIMFLDALLKLRQVCCDPRLVSLLQAKKTKQSAKLELLMQMLPDRLLYIDRPDPQAGSGNRAVSGKPGAAISDQP